MCCKKGSASIVCIGVYNVATIIIIIYIRVLVFLVSHHWSMIIHMVIKVSCIHSSLNSVNERMHVVFAVC